MTGITMKDWAARLRMLAVAAVAMAGPACSDSPTGAALPMSPEVDAGGSAVSATASGLLGTWTLVSLQEGSGAAEPVPAGTTFTATFDSEGRVSARVDCNRCAGGFTAATDTLAIGAMACTRAYCTASAPYDSRFETLLAGAQRWEARGEALEIKSERGSLRFVR
jgi:heat shock protein HslJ